MAQEPLPLDAAEIADMLGDIQALVDRLSFGDDVYRVIVEGNYRRPVEDVPVGSYL